MGQAAIGFYYPEGHEAHFEPGHPERPERIDAIQKALEAAGYWSQGHQVKAEKLEWTDLRAVHAESYLHQLQALKGQSGHLDMDTYLTPISWDLAQATAGGACTLASLVWEGQIRRGFALTRPPGHHAGRAYGMGFCLLNNIALAADRLIRRYGARQLAIIDLDLHHGNGTQEIFWERQEVFFASFHQSPLYPGSGMLSETGAGEGEGFTLNIPLPPGSGDQAYRAFTQEILVPILDRVKPEMLLVSFGFDPHWRDPLGHLKLSAGGCGRILDELVRWSDENCQGKIALFLEGGYDLEAAGACSVAVTAALLGEEQADPLGPAPQPEGKSWHQILAELKLKWNLD